MWKLVTGVPSRHASPVIELESRSSTVPSVHRLECGRGRPGDRPNSHASDPEPGRSGHLMCSVPCLRCPARRLHRQARPRRSSGSPGHNGELGWSMSYVAMVLDTTLRPKRA